MITTSSERKIATRTTKKRHCTPLIKVACVSFTSHFDLFWYFCLLSTSKTLKFCYLYTKRHTKRPNSGNEWNPLHHSASPNKGLFHVRENWYTNPIKSVISSGVSSNQHRWSDSNHQHLRAALTQLSCSMTSWFTTEGEPQSASLVVLRWAENQHAYPVKQCEAKWNKTWF